MMTTGSRVPIKNHILAALPEPDREKLLAHLEVFSLTHSIVLYEMGDSIKYIYFPNSGMVSLISHTPQGETLEVGIIGNEGVVGLSVFLETKFSPYRTLVQGAGEALRMKADRFIDECNRLTSLQRLMRHYTQARINQLTQTSICNRFHTIETRLCRWLLQCQDWMQSDELPLTQDLLAYMLGTHRPGVTLAAGALQTAGLIQYHRGQIIILDRERLQEASCDCYLIIREAVDWLANTT
jgi:CRP-like cAMP-binding protein